MSQEELRARVRRRIRGGELPDCTGGQTFAGHGRDSLCVCCGRPIQAQQVEYEVVFRSRSESLFAHVDCYRIWRQESTGEGCLADTAASNRRNYQDQG